MLSGKAKKAGVIGWPVEHSLSPRLHNYWLKHYGIDGVYIPMPVKPDDIKETILALPKMGFAGCNLTLPHKELVLPLLAAMDGDAKKAGMANTIIVKPDGSLYGMNTDSFGFWENIRPVVKDKSKAVLLGAGGAARAAAYALVKEGFKEIVVINRSEERAKEMASHVQGNLLIRPWDARDAALEGASLLVNATSLGMTGKDALDIRIDALPVSALVTDLIYAPLETKLLKDAKARGNVVVDGLGMLLYQAVPGFEAWFGVKPEVDAALRQYVLGQP